MDDKIKEEIKAFLDQASFKDVTEIYKNGQEFDGLKTVCYDDSTSLGYFVMGVVYSTASAMLNQHYQSSSASKPITPNEIKELILMIRDWVNA